MIHVKNFENYVDVTNPACPDKEATPADCMSSAWLLMVEEVL